MDRTAAAAEASPQAAPAPLFYRRPVALNAQAHASWRLSEGGFGFTAQANAVPLTAGEFAAAARSYPIVFGAEDAGPLALLGLSRTNLFVDGERWSERDYVPAYVRRYPFVLMATAGPEGFALAVDEASDRIVRAGGAGVALFEGGAPAPATRQALDFCASYTGEHRAALAFAAGLREQGLLTRRNADASFPGGRKLSLTGFEVVDAEKFSALPEAVVLDWHRKGWLAWVHLHLASLGRFAELLSRQIARDAAADSRA